MVHPEDRARQLHDEVRRLAAVIAETAEHSARVHDEAAEVHEALGEHALLDPDALRAHAVRTREFVASERAYAGIPVGTT